MFESFRVKQIHQSMAPGRTTRLRYQVNTDIRGVSGACSEGQYPPSSKLDRAGIVKRARNERERSKR